MTEHITKSIIVTSDVTEVYKLWSNFQYFPQFMDYVESVEKTGAKTSHWEVKGPLGKTVRWNAEMTRMEPNTRIGWNTKDDNGTVTTSGQVTFTSLPQNQTENTVNMTYAPTGGKVGEAVAQIFGHPE